MKKLMTGLLVSTVAASGLALASPAWAACGLGASSPTSSGLDGTGSRSECSGTVTLTVEVRKDVFGPDKVVGSASRSNFGNGSLTADGRCDGNGTYFTRTSSSSGNSIESGRVGRC